MAEKEMEFNGQTFRYVIDGEIWKLLIPKSQTRIRDSNQFKLITEETFDTVPLEISETVDEYHFSFTIDEHKKDWQEIKKLPGNEKLRAVNNVTQLFNLATTRVTFFIHPENVVFDENLMPQIIYRGIRNYVFPYELDEDDLLKQYKCFILSLFNEKYSFDDLYNGSLRQAKATEFQREVGKSTSLSELISFLKQSYRNEQEKSEQTMRLVPKKRYTLYKQLTIWFIVLAVGFSVPLSYMFFVKSPYQNKLLKAHREFLATDYINVIQALQHENIDRLPHQAKYILAYSFVKVEKLSDKQKETIMKNISLKSDAYYLKYWIQNGIGDFDVSIDLAKYMDDPQLTMYGLIKKMEQIKNDPNLTGAERDQQASSIQAELDKYNEEFELDIEDVMELDEGDYDSFQQEENDLPEEEIEQEEKIDDQTDHFSDEEETNEKEPKSTEQEGKPGKVKQE